MLTPELDKMREISQLSQQIGSFLDWLRQEKKVRLNQDINSILAEYFDIDLEKIEAEKMAILEDFRQKNDI